MKVNETNKYNKLAVGILFDAVGYLSFIFPVLDIGWAPLSAYLMTKMYKGKAGKIAAVFSFIEEALPMMDVIPTFTIMWIYTYVFSQNKDQIIEV